MCNVCMRMSTGKYIIRLLIIFHPGHVWMCWMFHKISSANKETILWIRKNNYIIFWLWNVYYYNILSGKKKHYAEEIRTTPLVKDRFYWSGMYQDIMTWIEECGRCIRRKSSTIQRASLVNILTTSPLELVCMECLTLEPSKGNYQHILVITDHFTRFAMAIPIRN
jgi:hypothetical protein